LRGVHVDDQVGVTRLNNGNATLIEHWNGSLVPSPAAL
jgi:hypothetical protein